MSNTSAETPPKISIITIVRNGMPFIAQTIDSVLSQHYPHREHIVIDGGSTDGTVDTLKTYSTHLTKWISEPDRGIADAFNKGLSYVTGDYVLMLNSDDRLASPDVLTAVAREIARHGQPALLYGDYDILNRDSGALIYHGSVRFTRAGMLHGQVLPHPTLFTHRTYFEKYGTFDPNFSIAMDYEWLLRGALQEQIVHMPMLISNIRDGGISTRNKARVVDEIILALKKNGHIASPWAAFKMHGYFFMRSFLRNLLTTVGLYKLFFTLRNRFKHG